VGGKHFLQHLGRPRRPTLLQQLVDAAKPLW
jgi:hypothetical protein